MSSQVRTGYTGDITPLLSQICSYFALGTFSSCKEIPFGYEDFNIIVTTPQGNYMVKFFADNRDEAEVARYIEALGYVARSEVNHPKLYSANGSILFQKIVDGIAMRAIVMDYIEGKSLFEMKYHPCLSEIEYITEQATKISQIQYRPTEIYDMWSISHFVEQFEQKSQYLSPDDLALTLPLIEKFKQCPYFDLPHAFVHGDLISTNIIKDAAGKLWFLDFGVANYYPRIHELAVLLCNVFFNEHDMASFEIEYNLAVATYQKFIPLTDLELETLPLLVQMAHGVHILLGNYYKVIEKNETEENDYWIHLGRIGLQYTSNFWRTHV